jgi:hypothetical protein
VPQVSLLRPGFKQNRQPYREIPSKGELAVA